MNSFERLAPLVGSDVLDNFNLLRKMGYDSFLILWSSSKLPWESSLFAPSKEVRVKLTDDLTLHELIAILLPTYLVIESIVDGIAQGATDVVHKWRVVFSELCRIHFCECSFEVSCAPACSVGDRAGLLLSLLPFLHLRKYLV